MYIVQKLNYSFDSLEPYIDTHTLALHYNKHTKNYLNKLNELLNSIHYDYRYSLKELPLHINEFPENLRADILFNLGGVLNHEIYFNSMFPNQFSINPYFNSDINRNFGNFENFMKLFKQKALSLKGSGYTFLVIDKNNNLQIINLPNQETPYSYNLIPLLALDLWEHAYYINYENNKELYIDNFFNIVDFSIANEYYKHKNTS